jgi:hypothetical protein
MWQAQACKAKKDREKEMDQSVLCRDSKKNILYSGKNEQTTKQFFGDIDFLLSNRCNCFRNSTGRVNQS